jgi:hypothetical protein
MLDSPTSVKFIPCSVRGISWPGQNQQLPFAVDETVQSVETPSVVLVSGLTPYSR